MKSEYKHERVIVENRYFSLHQTADSDIVHCLYCLLKQLNILELVGIIFCCVFYITQISNHNGVPQENEGV